MRICALGSVIRCCFGFGLIGLLLTGCKPTANESPLVKQGRTVYQTACTACHNSDPKVDGALGPAVAGASLEVLEARVVKGAYPSGYVPKRNTHLMVALPQYEADIPALHAYLNSLP